MLLNLLKQPGQGYVVAKFLPKTLKCNATPTQKRRPVRNAGFLSGDLTVLICGEGSMLNALIRKMFYLCVLADFIWRNGPETIKSLFRKEIFVNTRKRC